MVKKIICAAVITFIVLSVNAQENEVTRLPAIDNAAAHEYKDYSTYDRGFFWAAEAIGGYSCRLAHSNFSFAEIDVVGGYRFWDWLQVGLGFGGRYYFDNNKVRFSTIKWAFPLYVNVRGNIIQSLYRSVVPYYSIDLGGTFRDGFMFRPTIGLRIGQERSAFLIGIGYMAQDLASYNLVGNVKDKYYKTASFITLRLGYQF